MSVADDGTRTTDPDRLAPDPLTVDELEQALGGVGELPEDEPHAHPLGWTNPETPPPGKK
ncbi:MAG: hypothetical protein JOZ47_01425 [Kutzneria sp.]|nr:hypothetical protein [Kutzneria sp.]